MTRDEQLNEWRRMAAHDDCITAERMCAEDIREMVWRLDVAEACINAIATASPHGPEVIIRARLSALIDLAKSAME